MEHITVLRQEAVTALHIQKGSVVIDATLGGGGHATAMLEKVGPEGLLIGIDADPVAIDSFAKKVNERGNVRLFNANFAEMDIILKKNNITLVDAILADLGWRTDQFLSLGRGFSFHDNVGLEMTYGDKNTYEFSAYDVVNSWSESSLADIIFGYGEEHNAKKIARAIVDARSKTPITTAIDLAEIIASVSSKQQRINPATKTFQAIRIAVNDELSVLDVFITKAFDVLKSGGFLGIISFHSLEDRIVKYRFRSFVHDHNGELVNKKPITPTMEERTINPRSRSAKLRIIKKL